jgi:hypothetical protein
MRIEWALGLRRVFPGSKFLGVHFHFVGIIIRGRVVLGVPLFRARESRGKTGGKRKP